MLHGRTAELDRIEELLEQARRGDGAALIVLGEPGIGKTALLEAARNAAHDMLVLGATGVEAEAQLPFAALGEIAAPLCRGWRTCPSPRTTRWRPRWR